MLAKPAIQLANRLLQPLIKKIESDVSAKSQVLIHRIFGSYSKYLENTVERHSYFNSVVFKNEQRRLEDFYLPLTLVNGLKNKTLVINNYPKSEIDKIERLLIVDTAGMGKTTLLKFLFIKCVEQEAGIPMFVELRKLSRKVTLGGFLLEQLADIQGKCQPDLFYRLLESGDFVFFLDGYDEIGEPERAAVTASIQQFIEKTPGNKFIMTSREEGGLAAFPSFLRYTVRPLEMKEAYSLLRKYADVPLAETLIAKLDLPENVAIHEFLTNPLLTSLLFKSFEYKHTIPFKRHIFYRQVYEALFETHDLTKEGGEFERSKRSGLDVDRFEQILRAFGGLSYKSGKIEQSKSNTLLLLGDARTLASEVKTQPSNILHDLTHAVPLLVEDGNYIRWSHRSIQEYFAAEYICKNTKGRQTEILQEYFDTEDVNKHANLLLLCADIDRTAFDQSIGKTLAKNFLTEYEARRRKFSSNIPEAAVDKRLSLTVGRQIFLMNLSANKVLNKKIKTNIVWDDEGAKFHNWIRSKTGLNQTTMTIFQKNNLLVGQPHSAEINFINNYRNRLLLPFLENPQVNNAKPGAFLDDNIEFYRLDEDPLNPLNSPVVFEQINTIISGYVHWRFNPTAAKEYLTSLNTIKKAKSKLEPW
jgi:hypothetical protein